MKVSIVILNYNGKNYLEEFLPNVIEHSKGAEVVVVDNLSTDDSVAFLKESFPDIRLLINKENGGFAKGYNDGLKQIESDVYVLLNSDVEVTANWIQPCLDVLQSNDSIVAVQPKVLAQKEKDKFEHAGASGGYLDKNYFPFCRGRIFDEIETDQGQYDSNTEVFWATGACMFVKAEAYHELGGLDEDFFAHMEEIDLCWRMKKKGYQIYSCGESTVYHVGGGTLNYMNPRKTFLNFRNSLFMIVKNHEGILLPKIWWRMVLDGMAGIMFLFKFQFSHFWAVLRAHFALYANARTLSRKRKEIKAFTSSTNKSGIYRKNIIFQKFLKGVKKFSDLSSEDFIS